jgi:hypothetical protein
MTPQLYFRQHSTASDPAEYAHLYDALPDDLDSLCQAVRNVYVHYLSGCAFPPEHKTDVDARYVPQMLATILARNHAPLTEQRPPEQCFVGCCRDASLLLVSMLRHKGIPARLRVGFAPYIRLGVDGFAVDHVIAEVWDAAANRWKWVDPEQDAALIAHNQIDFDVHDIPRDRFIVGGAAWQQVRRGKSDPATFGFDPSDPMMRGIWPIRNRLIIDVAAFNRVELLLWDTWGWMNLDIALSDEALGRLDHLAALTLADDSALGEIQALYANTSEIRATDTVMCYSPAVAWHEVAVRL